MSEYFRKYIKNFPNPSSNIRFKTSFVNCIPEALQHRNWKQTEGDDWDIYWCQKQFIPETLDKMRLFPQKKINHFRNWYELCRKDLLSKNIKKYKRALEKEGKSQQANSYNYVPLTYNLPSEYPIFLQQFKKSSKQKCVWIMKPIGKSQGKGIFLFQNINKISDWSDNISCPEPYIVQRYIHDPLLIGNKKFDLRIYVLVTSHSPLTIYLYRSGFARFTHHRYELNDISNLEGHVTNVYYQKQSQNYDEQKGGKYQLDKLRLYMLSKYGSTLVQDSFFQIQQLIIKTLLATSKVLMQDKKCFQLYGFDILIDSKLKPWLVQVNASPSMTASTPTDHKLKTSLLDDVLTILNLQQILTGEQEQVGGFDLIYKNNRRVKFMCRNVSLLGCLNDRDVKMRKMAKTAALRLAEKDKQKKEQKVAPSGPNVNSSGKYGINIRSSTKPRSNTNVPPSTGGSNNSIGPESAKLPKMNNSIKNIDPAKKGDVAFRITNNSRDRGRVQGTNQI